MKLMITCEEASTLLSAEMDIPISTTKTYTSEDAPDDVQEMYFRKTADTFHAKKYFSVWKMLLPKMK
jgi:hypothetical protein